MAQLPLRQAYAQSSRQMSTDPHNDLNIQTNHYVGIDVGTGSARACIIDPRGDIVGLASENIGLWQPEHGYYVSTAIRHGRCDFLDLDADAVNRSNRLQISGGAFVALYSEH